MNFFELDISYFQRASQLSFQEILLLGLFHGVIFSLPFSAPLLICFRRFLLDGLKIGTIALAGTLFGQLSFLLFIFLGFRPLIQCWYVIEPFLAFLGMSLALKLATDLFHQKNFGRDDFGSTTSSNLGLPSFTIWPGKTGQSTFFQLNPELKIFVFQFLLIFFNPTFPATSTRLILGQDLLDGFWGSGVVGLTGVSPTNHGLNFALLYSFGFIFGSSILVGCLVFFLRFVFVQLNEFRFVGVATENSSLSSGTSKSTWLPGLSLLQFANPLFLNKAFVFLIIGCVLQGTVQYSWRLFTQYPLEFIGWQSFSATSQVKSLSAGEASNSRYGDPVIKTNQISSPRISAGDQLLELSQGGNMTPQPGVFNDQISTSASAFNSNGVASTPKESVQFVPSLQREFPSFDSNIRHREKNLPVERHIPVEKVNSRRTLTGRPPLNEEQKSDAYLKYNSFFLNKIEQSLEDIKILLRTPNFHIRTYEDILQLQKMKERYLKGQALQSGYFNSEMTQRNQNSEKLNLKNGIGAIESKRLLHSNSVDTPYLVTKAHPLENTTKGKPKFSYIRELFENKFSKSATSGQDALYIHDDLQIYNAIFKIIH